MAERNSDENEFFNSDSEGDYQNASDAIDLIDSLDFGDDITMNSTYNPTAAAARQNRIVDSHGPGTIRMIPKDDFSVLVDTQVEIRLHTDPPESPSISGLVVNFFQHNGEEFVRLSPAKIGPNTLRTVSVNMGHVGSIVNIDEPKYTLADLDSIADPNANDGQYFYPPRSASRSSRKGRSRANSVKNYDRDLTPSPSSTSKSTLVENGSLTSSSSTHQMRTRSKSRQRQQPLQTEAAGPLLVAGVPANQFNDLASLDSRPATGPTDFQTYYVSVSSANQPLRPQPATTPFSQSITAVEHSPSKPHRPNLAGIKDSWVKNALRLHSRAMKKAVYSPVECLDWHDIMYRAFVCANIKVDIDELKTSPVRSQGNDLSPQLLEAFWDSAVWLPSTCINVDTDADRQAAASNNESLSDHFRQQLKLLCDESSTPVERMANLYKDASLKCRIFFTTEQHICRQSLLVQWGNSPEQMNFVDWIRVKGVEAFKNNHGLQIRDPVFFTDLRDEAKMLFYTESFAEDYKINEMSFEDWFASKGQFLTPPSSSASARPQSSMSVRAPHSESDDSDLHSRWQQMRKTGAAFASQVPEEHSAKVYKLYATWAANVPRQEFADLVYDYYPELKKYDGMSEITSLFDDLNNEKVHEKTENQWPQFLESLTAQIKISSTDEELITNEETLLMANKPFPEFMEVKPHIKHTDFMPGGRFVHIFIPNYVYVPNEISQLLGLPSRPTSASIAQMLWRRLFQARHIANDLLDFDVVLLDCVRCHFL
jgi:hypothetical protein